MNHFIKTNLQIATYYLNSTFNLFLQLLLGTTNKVKNYRTLTIEVSHFTFVFIYKSGTIPMRIVCVLRTIHNPYIVLFSVASSKFVGNKGHLPIYSSALRQLTSYSIKGLIKQRKHSAKANY